MPPVVPTTRLPPAAALCCAGTPFPPIFCCHNRLSPPPTTCLLSPAPIHSGQTWSTKGVEGVHRFLARVYRLVTEQPLTDAEPDADQLRLLHQTIKKVHAGGRG